MVLDREAQRLVARLRGFVGNDGVGRRRGRFPEHTNGEQPLVRTFKLRGAESETDGWEIIGWDPIKQQIRSWIFDSNGGFGEATWVTDGDDWLVRASNVLPDGSRSTAENVLTRVDDNKFTWESQNRTLNGEPQPSLDKIEVQRMLRSQ
jgi:hypothetical protein